MKTHLLTLLFSASLMNVVACTGSSTVTDSGTPDSSTQDVVTADRVTTDTTVTDTTTADATPDVAPTDSTPQDATQPVDVVDASRPDAPTLDVQIDDVVSTDATGGGYGDPCGGIAGIQCGQGYTCVSNNPNIPDSGGNCHPLSGRGGPCGGTTRYPAVCEDGLTCIPPDVIRPGTGGTCG